ncbi:MAG: ribbon-helix-helix protein, CopG family [Oscillatoriales cyanobacterium RM2_1_1]|nr:ribbon-helix-helix protein, CopG family [Oscillatoriales cyanobacterium SM2_3_0]NJO47760.1 ribbon-helix-helix protein, CopG family [Oscillatoriales cyanobacterium RM2_1_1]
MKGDRKKMSQVADQLIRSADSSSDQNLDQASTPSKEFEAADPQSATTEETTSEIIQDSLRAELLGNQLDDEPTIRLTVDLPRVLHRRLNQLSLDSGKPKSELVRIMIRRALESVDY